MTLPSVTLFPQALLPLFIFEPRYRRMLRDALDSDRLFAVAMQKPGRLRETPYTVAGLGLVRVSVSHPDGTSHLILQGLTRVQLGPALQYKPYRVHRIDPLAPAASNPETVETLLSNLQDLLGRGLESGVLAAALDNLKPAHKDKCASPPFPIAEIVKHLQQLRGPEEVADLVTSALIPNPEDRQVILETLDVEQRLRHLIRFLKVQTHKPSPPSGC